MRVVRATGEAPLLDGVEHATRRFGIPRLGRHVDAVHPDERVVGGRTAVARRHGPDRSAAPAVGGRPVWQRPVPRRWAFVAGLLVLAACASEERSVTVVGSGAAVATPGPSSPSGQSSPSGRSSPSGQSAAEVTAVRPSAVNPSALDPSAVVGDPGDGTVAPVAGPSGVAPPVTAPPLPDTWRTVTVRLTRADGTAFDWCLLLADAEILRQRGLMGVRDLAGFDGMLFRFGAEQDEQFWMKDTPLPLSIAFFRADGSFVSAADMPPCPPAVGGQCPLYAATSSYADAIETAKGAVATAAVAAGTTIAVGGTGCPAH